MATKRISIQKIRNHFDHLPKEIKSYFGFFPKSLNECEKSDDNSHSWDTLIPSLFSKIEQARRMAIRGGLVKSYKINSKLTKEVVNTQHMSSKKFGELYMNVFGNKIPKRLINKIKHATSVRNGILHGSVGISDAKKKQAVLDILDYSKMFNNEVYKHAKFKPFSGDLKGRMGRAKRLDVSVSKWVLLGMGFSEKTVLKAVAAIKKKN